MTQEMENTAEAWAYVHGEMDDALRRAFERRMRKEPGLADEVAALQRMDAGLRVLTPLAETNEAELESRLLKEWEASRSQVRSSAAPRGALSWLFPGAPRQLGWALAGLAAACLVLAGGIYFSHPSPLAWERPTIGVLTYRGIDPAGHGQYDATDLRRFHDAIKKTMTSEYDKLRASAGDGRRDRRAPRWSLRTEIHELREGTVSVTLHAIEKGVAEPTVARSAYFQNPRVIDRDMADWARGVAAELHEAQPPDR